MNLESLTWEQFALIAVGVAVLDFIVGTVAAIIPPNYFSWASVARVLETHVLKRIAPIAGLAFLAQTFPETDPNHAALWATACGALALYVGETVKSLVTSAQVAQASAVAAAPAIPLASGPIPPDPVVTVTVDPGTSSLLDSGAVPPDAPEDPGS